MNQKLIFIPLVAQVLLTAIVFFRMYITRVGEMKSKRIHPQKIATSQTSSQHLVESAKVADNFSNQFEMPVLFYILTILLYVMQLVNTTYIALAWMFVALRYVHGYIHCTYNKVIHRFYAYASGSILLWLMWILFTIDLLRISQ